MADETDTTDMTSLMATTSRRALLGRMTPMERESGQFMRAPDHGEDGADGGGDGSGADGDGAGASGDDGGGGSGDGAGDGAGKDQAGADAGAGSGDDDASLMGKAGKKDGEDDKPDPATLPPEKYELTAPEGFTIDEALQAAADPIFREIGLTNEQANKLMPLVPAFAEKLVGAQNDAHQAMATDWAKQAKADPVLGGANWKETETFVARALDTAAAKLPSVKAKDADGKDVTLTGAQQVAEFRELMDSSKLGNHPTWLRVVRFFGEQVGEGGSFVRADTGAPIQKSREDVLYGAKGD